MFKEFREFIARGNVVDLAVGVSIGGSFSQLVNSLINNVVTPPIQLALATARAAASKAAGGAANAVGFDPTAAPTGVAAFLSQLGSFLLMSSVIFVAVKVSNSVKRRFAARARAADVKAPPRPSQEDLQVRQIAQNERIIELLEQMAARDAATAPKNAV